MIVRPKNGKPISSCPGHCTDGVTKIDTSAKRWFNLSLLQTKTKSVFLMEHSEQLSGTLKKQGTGQRNINIQYYIDKFCLDSIKDIFWFTPRSFFVPNAQLVKWTKTRWTPLVAFLSLFVSNSFCARHKRARKLPVKGWDSIENELSIVQIVSNFSNLINNLMYPDLRLNH